MSAQSLERRVSKLEQEVLALRAQLTRSKAAPTPDILSLAGAFEGVPEFEEAMRLGRKYRESLRPKARRKRKPKT